MRKLDKEIKKVDEMLTKDTKFLKKVEISDLLAWNNETFCTELLQHCFLHRRTEDNVTFSVSDILLGARNVFQPSGQYETSCKKFLEECYEGRERTAMALLNSNNINPDLCDAKGNSGIMLATVRGRIPVIAMLVNFGAKIDIVNDEGLTPLTLAILQYISVKFTIGNWEKAFLQEPQLEPEVLQELAQWRPKESLSTKQLQVSDSILRTYSLDTVQVRSISQSIQDAFKLAAVSVFSSNRLATVQDKFDSFPMNSKMEVISIPVTVDTCQNYFFDLTFRRVKKVDKKKKEGKPKKGGKKKEKKPKKSPTVKTKKDKKPGKDKKDKKKKKASEAEVEAITEKEENPKDIHEVVLRNKLELIKKTVSTLLLYGSNPNIGEVPLKPLFLSIFTSDIEIVTELLKNNAQPNVLSTQDNLSCLHVIASLIITEEKLQMARLLLEYGANPNAKTHPRHWIQLKDELIGDGLNAIDVPDDGKNALHLLCLREDFAEDQNITSLAKLLVEYKCDHEELYLGHTPLSLAVLRGNVPLVMALLQTNRVDPHQVLGYDMGNVFTLLFLKRFEEHLEWDMKTILVNTLIDCRFNPLNSVGASENCIVFIEEENERNLPKKEEKEEKGKKGKKDKKGKDDKSKSSKSKKDKKSKGKKGSGKGGKGKDPGKSKEALELKKYVEDETRKILFRRVQSEAVKFLYALLTENLFTDRLIMTLARFVTPLEALNLMKILFGHSQIAPDRFSYIVVSDLLQFINLQMGLENTTSKEELEKIAWKSSFITLEETLVPLPEIDPDEDKYKVCFQCLRGRNKKLLWCPLCELVYFCSEECNEKNVQSCNLHRCQIVFYKRIEEALGSDKRQSSRFDRLLHVASIVRDERLAEFELFESEERMTRVKFPSKSVQVKHEETKEKLKQLQKARKVQQKENQLLFLSVSNLQASSAKTMSSVEVERMLTQAIREDIEDITNEPTREASETASQVSPTPKTKRSSKGAGKITKGSTSGRDFASSLVSDVTVLIRSYTPTPRDKAQFKQNTKLKVTKSSKVKRLDKKSTKKSEVRTSKYSITTDKFKFLPQFLRVYHDSDDSDSNLKAIKINKEYYMKMLSKVFADFNLPLLLLPYACFKDGQVYYSMSDNVHFHKSFQRLNIPN